MKKKIISVIFLVTLICQGCSFWNTGNAEQTQEGTGFVKSEAGYYDSADTAVVVKKNEDEGSITLLNTTVSRNYTLKYDGATEVYDKHKEALSMSQIELGEIVDVTFVKISKRLNSIQIAENSWSYSDVEKFEFGRNNQTMQIGEEEFALYQKTPVLSNGERGELIDLTSSDVLTVRGIEHTVYSIVVDKGHGYLRLANDQYFVGGWVEVGQKVIQPITEDMLLVVPEGSYQVLLTNSRIEGTKEVTIERDGELELDVGDIKPEEAKYGKLIFSIVPSEASLYIDGNQEDATKVITLEYGIHQMIVKADGYKTITQYIKVGQEKANISVELEAMSDSEKKNDNGSDSMVDADTMSSNNTVTPTALPSSLPSSFPTPSTASSASTVAKVHIEAPEGAEVYLDSNYIGVAPISFSKSAGTHIVSLRKSGYQTKSYTLQLDTEQKDISYSFADLIEAVSTQNLKE